MHVSRTEFPAGKYGWMFSWIETPTKFPYLAAEVYNGIITP